MFVMTLNLRMLIVMTAEMQMLIVMPADDCSKSRYSYPRCYLLLCNLVMMLPLIDAYSFQGGDCLYTQQIH